MRPYFSTVADLRLVLIFFVQVAPMPSFDTEVDTVIVAHVFKAVYGWLTGVARACRKAPGGSLSGHRGAGGCIHGCAPYDRPIRLMGARQGSQPRSWRSGYTAEACSAVRALGRIAAMTVIRAMQFWVGA